MEKLYRTLDNINIFKETQTHCKTDTYLKESMKETDAKQKFISEIEEYEKYFETVGFAVYCVEEEIRNYKIFKEVLESVS